MRNPFKTFLLYGGTVLFVATTSCSKEEPLTTKNPVKKSEQPTSAEAQVEEFLALYNSYADGAAVSETPSIAYEEAIWLIEASLNYKNSVNPEGTTYYVDHSSPFTEYASLPYGYNSEGDEVLISEYELLNLFEDLLLENEGRAPVTDVILTESTSQALSLTLKGYDLTTTAPEGIDPIGSTEAYTAVREGTCDGNVPSGSFNWFSGPMNAADRMAKAIKPYYLQYSGGTTGWVIYGWYHSIDGHTVGEQNAVSGFEWISHTQHYDPILGGVVGAASSTGQIRDYALWGGYEANNNLASRNEYECLDQADMNDWINKLETMAETEASLRGGGSSVLEVRVWSRPYGSGTPYYHESVWISGVLESHPID